MKNSTILFIGLLSAWADAATTITASHYPELKEANPHANSFLELGSVLTGQALILYGGEKLKADRDEPRLNECLVAAGCMFVLLNTPNLDCIAQKIERKAKNVGKEILESEVVLFKDSFNIRFYG